MDLKLIIFAKNLIVGKVKTRIANKIGAIKALDVYKILLSNTLNIVDSLPGRIHPVVYLSESSEEELITSNFKYEIKVQKGRNIGERMANAFENEFSSGVTRVCLIGTDIYDLNKQIILSSFEDLSKKKVVIGPAMDGGYYLIGMNQYYPDVFRGIAWGQPTVLHKTITYFESIGIDYHLLPILNDVDEFEDIPEEILKKLNFR